MTYDSEKKPDRIVIVRGHEFHLFKYRDEYDGSYLFNLPDFDENPEYSDDGRPFVLNVQEGCSKGKTGDPEITEPYMCCDCVWFHRENQNDLIGVCMCDAQRCEVKGECICET